jgi:hypothetical protein
VSKENHIETLDLSKTTLFDERNTCVTTAATFVWTSMQCIVTYNEMTWETKCKTMINIKCRRESKDKAIMCNEVFSLLHLVKTDISNIYHFPKISNNLRYCKTAS